MIVLIIKDLKCLRVTVLNRVIEAPNLWIYLFLKEFLLHPCECSFVVSIGIIHGFFYLQNHSLKIYDQSYIVLIFHKASNYIYLTFLSHNISIEIIYCYYNYKRKMNCWDFNIYILNVTFILACRICDSISSIFFIVIPGNKMAFLISWNIYCNLTDFTIYQW